MERTQELFEKIEGYLNKTLSEQELIAFENEIASDPELTLEVEKHSKLHKVLSDADALHFKEKLEKIKSEVKQEESENDSNPYLSYFKIAALIIILFGVGSLLWNNFKGSDDYTDLYVSYYEPYPAEDIIRGDVNEMYRIRKNYADGDYEKVVNALTNTTTPISSELFRLYLGNSYLNLDKEQEALKQFEAITETSNYFEAASWYRALTYLRLENTDMSTKVLRSIVEYNGIYKQKAMELIKKLEK